MPIIQAIVLILLAAVFIIAGVLHFTRLRDDFARIVPPILPYPHAIVFITGIMEIARGVGLLLPQTRLYAGIALILFLIAVYPANYYAAKHDILVGGLSSRPQWRRFLLQILLIALLVWVTLFPA